MCDRIQRGNARFGDFNMLKMPEIGRFLSDSDDLR